MADVEVRELGKDLAEYIRDGVCCEGKISWPVAFIVEELRKEFPKHLSVDGSENAQQASARHEIKERQRTSNVEFPRREQQSPLSVLNLKGSLAFEANLAKRAFCSTEFLCD